MFNKSTKHRDRILNSDAMISQLKISKVVTFEFKNASGIQKPGTLNYPLTVSPVTSPVLGVAVYPRPLARELVTCSIIY